MGAGFGEIAPAVEHCTGIAVNHGGGLSTGLPVHLVPEILELLVRWHLVGFGALIFSETNDRPLPGTPAVNP